MEVTYDYGIYDTQFTGLYGQQKVFPQKKKKRSCWVTTNYMIWDHTLRAIVKCASLPRSLLFN